MSLIQSLTHALLSKRGGFAFLASLAILVPLLALSSNIIVFGTWQLNSAAEASGIIIIAAIALLASLNAAVMATSMIIPNGAGAGGALAFLTSACPVCQPSLFLWLGSGFAFLADISVFIGLASIALLAVSLNNLANNKCGGERGNNGKIVSG